MEKQPGYTLCMFARQRFAFLAFALCLSCISAQAQGNAPRFVVSYSAGVAEGQPFDGRLYLLLSTDPGDEPRNQIDDTPRSQMMFGVDVGGLQPGQTVGIDDARLGLSGAQPADRAAGRVYRAGRAATSTRPFIAPTARR